MRRILTVVTLLILAAPFAYPQEEGPPLALKRIGDAAVAIFDAANTRDWPAADSPLEDMRDALKMLPQPLPYPDLRPQLRGRATALAEEIRGRRTIAVMNDANAVTKLVVQIANGFGTRVPFEIAILPYYGRQLEIAAQRGRVNRTLIADLRSDWNRIESVVIQKADTADARRFTDIVVQLEGAKKPADEANAARAELQEAAKLSELFAVQRTD